MYSKIMENEFVKICRTFAFKHKINSSSTKTSTHY